MLLYIFSENHQVLEEYEHFKNLHIFSSATSNVVNPYDFLMLKYDQPESKIYNSKYSNFSGTAIFVALLGGYVAEQRYLNLPVQTEPPRSSRFAKRALDVIKGQLSRRSQVDLEINAETNFLKFLPIAEELIDRYWDTVNKLAIELQEKKRLSREEVRRLVNNSMTPAELDRLGIEIA